VHTTDTLVIGAGQAGLAASRLLTERGHDHVVLDSGRVGERWRSATWDSLHLLTPNWMNALPGAEYGGPDPDGFATASEFVDYLGAYAGSFDAPVEEHAGVASLHQRNGCFQAVTDGTVWRATNVIIATGWCDRPAVPAMSAAASSRIRQIVPSNYRNPGSLAPGGVLVVGASSTGIQLADEMRAAGRPVTLAVGSHTRLPRTYRGMDIYWWLERLGVLETTIDELADHVRARREPSIQAIGRPDRRQLDLATLQRAGVRLVGRLTGIDGLRVHLAPDLRATVVAADRRMRRLLHRIDLHIDLEGLRQEVLDGQRLPAVTVGPVLHELELRGEGITNIVWATGYRRSYPWFQLPVLDQRGEICQRRGRTPVPGLYVLGQRFQYRRSSNFIGGVGRDAAFVVDQITDQRRATCTSASH
jgi:putative flavoprotein involved in K+ transport